MTASDADRARIHDMLTRWTGCWCGPQQYPDHDPRVRDCPQHGSEDCRHMAEGIAGDLRRLIGDQPQAADTGDREALDRVRALIDEWESATCITDGAPCSFHRHASGYADDLRAALDGTGHDDGTGR